MYTVVAGLTALAAEVAGIFMFSCWRLGPANSHLGEVLSWPTIRRSRVRCGAGSRCRVYAGISGADLQISGPANHFKLWTEIGVQTRLFRQRQPELLSLKYVVMEAGRLRRKVRLLPERDSAGEVSGSCHTNSCQLACLPLPEKAGTKRAAQVTRRQHDCE
jgi:hypothetical protein